MNGVEILNSEIIYETTSCPWLIALFAGIGFLVSLTCCIFYWIDVCFDAKDIAIVLVCTLVGAIIGVVAFLNITHETDTVDYIEYKVTIDDSVSMNEFLDKYEILDQEGKIYTVKERE
jgi:RsiW-degrading membrane proteinase PrsW (M82 family)